MKRTEEQKKLIIKINQLLEKSFEQNELIMSRDGKYHPAIAVLDLLRLTVENDIIKDGGDKFADIIYKVSGSEILKRTINKLK